VPLPPVLSLKISPVELSKRVFPVLFVRYIVSYRVALLSLCVAVTSPTTITCVLISLSPTLLTSPTTLSISPSVLHVTPCPVPSPRYEVTCEDTLIAADSMLGVSTGTGIGSTRGQDGVCILLTGGCAPFPPLPPPPTLTLLSHLFVLLLPLLPAYLVALCVSQYLNSPLSPLHSHSSASFSISRRTDGSVLLSSPPLTQRTHRMRFTLNPRCT
jgi:hypothetical protein